MEFNPILLLNNFKKAHKIVVKNLRICKRIDQLLNNNNVNINKCSELLLKKCLTFQATVLKISHIKNLAFWGIFWESLKTESLHKFNCFFTNLQNQLTNQFLSAFYPEELFQLLYYVSNSYTCITFIHTPSSPPFFD